MHYNNYSISILKEKNAGESENISDMIENELRVISDGVFVTACYKNLKHLRQ